MPNRKPISAREFDQDQPLLVLRVKSFRDQAQEKRAQALKLYNTQPDEANRLSREALALDECVEEILVALMKIKQNPMPIPEYVERVPLRTVFGRWLKKWV